jgi:hypothetical protein
MADVRIGLWSADPEVKPSKFRVTKVGFDGDRLELKLDFAARLNKPLIETSRKTRDLVLHRMEMELCKLSP